MPAAASRPLDTALPAVRFSSTFSGKLFMTLVFAEAAVMSTVI